MEAQIATENVMSGLIAISIVLLAFAIYWRGRPPRRQPPGAQLRAQANEIAKLLGPDDRLNTRDLNDLELLAYQELRLTLAIDQALDRAEGIWALVPGKQPPSGAESRKLPGEVKKFLIEKITKLANGLIKSYTGLGEDE
jgi:hypothetical protein